MRQALRGLHSRANFRSMGAAGAQEWVEHKATTGRWALEPLRQGGQELVDPGVLLVRETCR